MAKINGLHKYVSSIEKYWVKNFGKKKSKIKRKGYKRVGEGRKFKWATLSYISKG